jgi:hypothetical protein
MTCILATCWWNEPWRCPEDNLGIACCSFTSNGFSSNFGADGEVWILYYSVDGCILAFERLGSWRVSNWKISMVVTLAMPIHFFETSGPTCSYTQSLKAFQHHVVYLTWKLHLKSDQSKVHSQMKSWSCQGHLLNMTPWIFFGSPVSGDLQEQMTPLRVLPEDAWPKHHWKVSG